MGIVVHERQCYRSFFFFFQAEDGIRDLTVTGVQTCALPILDELAQKGISDVWEVRPGSVNIWQVDPADHGLAIDDVAGLSGAEPLANAARIERLLDDGRDDAAGLAALLLNGGAAIYVAGLVPSYADGVARAREVLASGRAREALERLRRASASAGPS